MLFLVTLGREGREAAYILHLPVLGRTAGAMKHPFFLSQRKRKKENLKKNVSLSNMGWDLARKGGYWSDGKLLAKPMDSISSFPRCVARFYWFIGHARSVMGRERITWKGLSASLVVYANERGVA